LAIPSNSGLFLAKTANEWIEESKLRPVPKLLFSEFWYESEICILFADTGVGKSILAVQIADSITTGNFIPGFKMKVAPQSVLYLDFELNSKQFEARYSVDYTSHYNWSDGFQRVEFNPDVEMPEGVPYEKYLSESIEKLIQEQECL
jgi:hypothetical protein